MLELVGLVLILTVLIYAISKGMIGDLARPYLSMVWPPRAPEITSSPSIAAPSDGVRPRTDGTQGGRTDPTSPDLKPATLDTVRSLRAHGYTRDEARALLRGVDRSLGNNLWADAAPVESDDDSHVTPYAGRRTKASYYPDNPELEYAEPR